MSKRATVLAALSAMTLAAGTAYATPSWLDHLLQLFHAPPTLKPVDYSLHYAVTGTRIATTANSATFRFSGPLTVATVDAADARWHALSAPVGRIIAWDVTFSFKPGAAQPPVNTDTKLDTSAISLQLGDSMLKALVNNPSTPFPETNIPFGFNGRMLFELGRVPGTGVMSATLPYRYRETGCLGLQSAAPTGALSGKRGTLCTSGTFSFPTPVKTIADIQAATKLAGESNVTLVMQ